MQILDVLKFPEGELVLVMLVIIRLLSFFVAMPLVGSENVPATIKIGMALTMAVCLFPLARSQVHTSLAMNELIIGYAVRETMIGVCLGMIVRFIFFAVAMGGELIGSTSGLGSAAMFNPTIGTQSSVFEQFQTILATLLFFGLNGHHLFLEGIFKSFEILPIGQMSFNLNVFKGAADLISQVVVMAIQIAAPVLAAVFIAHITLGVLGRAVPQLNVLMTSIQVTVLLSIFVLILALPSNVESISGIIKEMSVRFNQVMRGM